MLRNILTFALPILALSGAVAFSGCGDSDDGATDTTQTASGNGGGGSSAGSSGSSGQAGEAGSSQNNGGTSQGGSSGAAQGGESGTSGQAGSGAGAGGDAGAGGSDAGAGGSDAGSGGSDAAGAGGSDAGAGGSDAGAGGNGGAGGDVHDGPFVAWKEKPTEPYMIKGEVALDWGFFYDVQLKGKPEADFQIELERCQKPAGVPESCQLGGKQQAKEGGGAVKYGVDPSQYNNGENTYRMTWRLYEKDALVSLDELKLVVIAEP